MAYNIFSYGPTGRSIYVDELGQLIINTDPSASGYIVGYGDEGYPVLVDASGRLLVQNDNPTNSLAAMSDTDVTGAVSGQFLMWDGTDWIDSDVTQELADLTNVISSTPTSGQSLVYNGSNWVNQTVAAASGSSNPYSVQLLTASGQTVNAAVGKTYSADMASGVITLALPASPSTNDYVVVKDKGNSQTNLFTVSGSGNNIDGQGSIVVSSNYAALTLVWDSSEWIIL